MGSFRPPLLSVDSEPDISRALCNDVHRLEVSPKGLFTHSLSTLENSGPDEAVVRAPESQGDRDSGDRHGQLSLATSRGLCVVWQPELLRAVARPHKLACALF